MAMKIHCTKCTKRISIDEAFAGGVCRCPYCSALVFIAGGFGPVTGTGARPVTPTSRPMTPTEVVVAPEDLEAYARDWGQEEIPTADPVKIQGIFTIVLLALLLVMVIALAVGLAIMISAEGDRDGVGGPGAGGPGIGGPGVGGPGASRPVVVLPPLAANPFLPSSAGPAVAGDVRVEPPVVYVLDAGGSMREAYGFAMVMTGASIRSLGSRQCNIVVCLEAKDRKWSPRSRAGGKAGAAAARQFMEGVIPGGATDVSRGFRAALAMKPGTVVLFARKYIGGAKAMGGKAREQGVRVVAVSLDGVPDAAEAMAKLAGAAGGQARAYSLSEMAGFIDKLPPSE